MRPRPLSTFFIERQIKCKGIEVLMTVGLFYIGGQNEQDWFHHINITQIMFS